MEIPNLNESLAEETGIHIGDGSMGIYKSGALFSVAGHPIDDKEYYEKHLKKLFKELYNIDLRLRTWSRAYGFQICSKKLLNFKRKIGLPVGPKTWIRIPKWIKENRKFMAACLRGIFDTDGTFYIEKKYGRPYPRIQISSISSDLIKDIALGLEKSEIKYGKWKEKPIRNWKARHVIAVRGYKSIEKWMGIIGTNNPKHIQKYKLSSLSVRK